MQIDEVFEQLDIEVDKQLYDLSKKDLLTLLVELVSSKDKKFLSQLMANDNYFELSDLVKALEKKHKLLLFKILNEPKEEKELRLPIGQFIKNNWDYPAYQVEVTLPKTRRKIDVIGCKCGGIFTVDQIVAVEIKTTPTRSAIDSAFSQAHDYLECSDFSYVAVSPYLFLKYPQQLLKKVKDHKKKIGLLLVDKMRVINVIQEAKETSYDNEKYKEIQSKFKK